MDKDDPTRWTWNEPEGLGRTYTSGIIDDTGRQVRYGVNDIVSASVSSSWASVIGIDMGVFGKTGNVRADKYGNYIIAGYEGNNEEIPYVIRIDRQTVTQDISTADLATYESLWAIDNDREWVYENANVPAEGYFSWEEPPTPEEQAAISESLTRYYYALPTLYQQRPGLAISQTGLIFMSWMHGNQTIIPIDEGNNQYKAVGMRIAVSRDNGKTFQPLIPDRIGNLQGVN